MAVKSRFVHCFLWVLITGVLLSSCGKEGTKGAGQLPPPQADFVSNKTQVVIGDSVTFSDRSLGAPFSYFWTFQGGTPGTSESRIPPKVVYNEAGTYSVKLVVRNAYGVDSINKSGLIRVFSLTALPNVITGAASNIGPASASIAGNLTREGDAPVTEKGICYDTFPNPTISQNKIVGGSGLGAFSVNLTGLKDNKTYYYKAYAINADVTVYGQERSFTTKEFDFCEDIATFTDARDGKTYRLITVGSQVWMGDNLNFNMPGSWCYDGLASNCEQFGRLYTYQMALNACPSGWHLPTDTEWSQLVAAVAPSPGGKLKSKEFWSSPNTGAVNSVCFSGVPGGYRNSENEQFNTTGFFGYWWSATADGTDFAICRSMTFNSTAVERLTLKKADGLSIRCVKN
jgi:uncharacterized protein (TIGR02145 family)